MKHVMLLLQSLAALPAKMARSALALLTAGLALLGIAGPALAADPVDYGVLTDAVDFSSVIVALMAVAAALMLVYIAWKGAKMILAAVRGG